MSSPTVPSQSLINTTLTAVVTLDNVDSKCLELSSQAPGSTESSIIGPRYSKNRPPGDSDSVPECAVFSFGTEKDRHSIECIQGHTRALRPF